MAPAGQFAGINLAIQAATPFALAGAVVAVMGGYDQVIWILFAGAALPALAFTAASHGAAESASLSSGLSAFIQAVAFVSARTAEMAG